MRLAFLPGRVRRAAGRQLRRLRGVERRVVRLAPDGEPLGRVAFSYVVDPFLARSEGRIAYAHTQDWESWTMARTWRSLGFRVDVLHWTNADWLPDGPLDVLVDARSNLERLAPHAGAGCLRIFHAETAHWRTNDEAQRRRLDELEARRGIRLTRTRLVGENRAIETADCATVLGGEWTLSSYRPFGKPLYRVPISNAFVYPSPEAKDFEACRGRFLWFGGVGFVHKGLDRVLEAFAGVDGLALGVAAPLDREPDFAEAYRRELWRTPNVRALGWLDVASARFEAVAAQTLGMVFPSCSEGGGGSAITAMHVGLIPLLTHETSVDLTPDQGVILADAGVETIRRTALALSARPAEELRATALAAWKRAQAEHTRQAFETNYRRTALEILERFRPELVKKLEARGGAA
ncbi:MAG TPA: glycosyltransferase [Thermoanaerobaculia bacterium]|nr:glycosyltransferase [Thermoanaerobaculia bacterium]